ncbi:GDP-L-fucose synthase [Pirellulales bacterium]|nr:GDP-L-fucose synthase [Pirellulales bacterium]
MTFAPLAIDAPVMVTGHRGLVGRALLRRLADEGFEQLVVAPRTEVDLRDPRAVDEWFAATRPRYVIHAAGLVGGIGANQARPAEFLRDNLLIGATVIDSAWRHGVERLLYLGSSCIYPRECPQPMQEEHLLSGPLEPTNDGYAVAKLAGVKACQAYRRQYGCRFISTLPANLYGPHDHFTLEGSHVVPALIRKFHDCRASDAPGVTLWGSGTPRREFLFVDDLAHACLFLLANYDDAQPINVGVGSDVTIKELAEEIRATVCPDAEISWDATKPDGTPQKLLDTSRLRALGWQARTDLSTGLAETYAWFQEHAASNAAPEH